MTHITDLIRYFSIELIALKIQVEILRNAILYIQSLERCLGITHHPEEAKLVSFMANHGRQRYEHFKMSLQDKIEDIKEGGMDRKEAKEADDVNQVLSFLPRFFKPIYFSFIQGFFVRISEPQHQ